MSYLLARISYDAASNEVRLNARLKSLYFQRSKIAVEASDSNDFTFGVAPGTNMPHNIGVYGRSVHDGADFKVLGKCQYILFF